MAGENDSTFGQRMRAVREAYGLLTGRPGLNQAKFAKEELGMPDTEAYRRWERNETNPTMAGLKKIRDVTGISLDYLVAGTKAGIDDPSDYSAECGASFCERLTWAREIFAADPAEAAKVMGVPAVIWQKWETGRDPMPEVKMVEFAHRFSVSMPYLLNGLPVGVAPALLRELRRRHPELWRGDHTSTDTDSDSTFPVDRQTLRIEGSDDGEV